MAMGQTLTALETWIASNCLCLKNAKTKFVRLGTRKQLAKLNLIIDLSTEFPNYTSCSRSETLVTHWTKSLLLHLTLIALVATASTNCVSFALSLALFQLALRLPLCTLSSQLVYRHTNA